MRYRMKVHPGADQKLADWRHALPGSRADRNRLLRGLFAQLCEDSVKLVGRRLGTDPVTVRLPGPNDDLFEVSVRLVGRDEIEVTILDLFARPSGPRAQ